MMIFIIILAILCVIFAIWICVERKKNRRLRLQDQQRLKELDAKFEESLHNLEEYSYEHKGYRLIQTSFNWHYVIVNMESSKVCINASCSKKLTEQEAKAHIEWYIASIRDAEGSDE
jgi:hypothetical protein